MHGWYFVLWVALRWNWYHTESRGALDAAAAAAAARVPSSSSPPPPSDEDAALLVAGEWEHAATFVFYEASI